MTDPSDDVMIAGDGTPYRKGDRERREQRIAAIMALADYYADRRFYAGMINRQSWPEEARKARAALEAKLRDAELVERLDALYASTDLMDAVLTRFDSTIRDNWPAIRALLAAAPPREPTTVMKNAGESAWRTGPDNDWQMVAHIWRAMYDAAPGAGESKQSAADIGMERPEAPANSVAPVPAADPSALIAEATDWLKNELDAGTRIIITRLRDALAAQDERDRKQCELLQAYAANEREQHERISALERERDEAKSIIEQATRPGRQLLPEGLHVRSVKFLRAGDQQTTGSEVVGGKQPRDEPSGPNR